MNNRLNLFSQVFSKVLRSKPTFSRKLYTDTIYPYPRNYIHNVEFPSQVMYRETWELPPWHSREKKIATYMIRFFWTWFFYNLLKEPNALIGHFLFPEPFKWTDEELGIPPDSAGSYIDWLDKRENANKQQ